MYLLVLHLSVRRDNVICNHRGGKPIFSTHCHIHDSNESVKARMDLNVLNGKGRHDEAISTYHKVQPKPIFPIMGTNLINLINVYKERVSFGLPSLMYHRVESVRYNLYQGTL